MSLKLVSTDTITDQPIICIDDLRSVAAPASVSVIDTAYWTRSLSARDRLQHLTSTHPHPNLGCDEVILDDQTRRLLDDSHLLIATQRLVLLHIIGQGALARYFLIALNNIVST